MANFKELNDQVGLADQMQSNEDGSIVLINVFTIAPSDKDALLAAWSHDADFMKAQPGYNRPSYIRLLVVALHTLITLFEKVWKVFEMPLLTQNFRSALLIIQ